MGRVEPCGDERLRVGHSEQFRLNLGWEVVGKERTDHHRFQRCLNERICHIEGGERRKETREIRRRARVDLDANRPPLPPSSLPCPVPVPHPCLLHRLLLHQRWSQLRTLCCLRFSVILARCRPSSSRPTEPSSRAQQQTDSSTYGQSCSFSSSSSCAQELTFHALLSSNRDSKSGKHLRTLVGHTKGQLVVWSSSLPPSLPLELTSSSLR